RGPSAGEGANDASPSPSTDGQHIWAYFGTGDLVCTDMDGTVVWHENLQKRYGPFRIMHGMHTSPVLYGDRLYMQLLHQNANIVFALDKATGKEVGKIDRISDGHAEFLDSYDKPSCWID